MSNMHIHKMRSAHKKLLEFKFNKVKINKGYSDRILRIDLGKMEIVIEPVTKEMKDLWVGGKGFDLWLTFNQINKDTKWNSPENPICFSVGPLGGTTSFPGAGKTIVTAVSPATNSIMDSNVGGYFGPYLKFAGFDSMYIVGKATKESIIYIDAVNEVITIEEAPLENLNSHLAAEEFTEMYADNDLDLRNIAVVSSGEAAEHSRMGLLNFSFWDWRRNLPRLKQAGRGGIGTVFRDKKLKALIIKNKEVTPAWTIEESKASKMISPKKLNTKSCKRDIEKIDKVIKKWNSDPNYLMEIMQHIQKEMGHISKLSVDRLNTILKTPKTKIYQMATFYKEFTLDSLGENIVEVCMGAGCHGKGAKLVLEAFSRELNLKAGETSKDNKYTLLEAACLGACDIAPVIKVNGNLLGKVKETDVKKIIKNIGELKSTTSVKADTKTFEGRELQVMKNHKGGYPVFESALKDTPENIISTIKSSGLLGRGGAGYPVYKKWEECRKNSIEKKEKSIIVCNSAIFEPDPHFIIEGILIGALAVNADEGIVCFRNEHLDALKRFQIAIEFAKKNGLLGDNILGSNFSFNIKLRHGAGGFVIGESKALVASINGVTGIPSPKYIRHTEAGVYGRPTVVNNVETWANIVHIIKGDNLKNNKLFSLSGDVKKACNIEVPLGTTLREIIKTFGGGITKKRDLKAVQIGGASGGYLPESKLDMKLDYHSLAEIDQIMGSGVIVVKDQFKCIVDSVKYQIDFLLSESCGKCTPCREGLYALSNIFKRITNGKGQAEDLKKIEDIAINLKESSLCNFGRTASTPIMSSIEYFLDEYKEHIEDGKCKSGTCKELFSFNINKSCTGCTICAINCPTSAISGSKKEHHTITQNKCIKCGVCLNVCNFKAVEVI